MGFVDWVCNIYASGDYSKPEAFVVGERVVHDIRPIMLIFVNAFFIAETHPEKPEKTGGLENS